jgi:hypothetical protein
LKKSHSHRHIGDSDDLDGFSFWMLGWLGWAVAGFLSCTGYLLTGRPFLAALGLSTITLWPDVITAWWIAAHDRNRTRRVGLILGHLANGANSSCVVAVVLLVVAAVGERAWPQWLPLISNPEIAVMAGMALLVGSSVIFSLATLLWCIPMGITLWIDSQPLILLRRGDWPPSEFHKNDASTSILVFLLVLIPVPLVTTSIYFGDQTAIGLAGWLTTLLLMGASFPIYFRLSECLIAETPLECWPELVPEVDEEL